MTRWYPAVVMVALAAVWTTVHEGNDHGEPLVGAALWLVYAVFAIVAAAALAGVMWALRRRPPSRALAVAMLLAAMVFLFPTPASWDSDEGPDSLSGLTSSLDAAALVLALETTPTLPYSESCCD